MDGIHDLGGKDGYGPVDRTGDDDVFQARWEAVVFSMLAAGPATGAWRNSDRFRHAIERVDPEAYLAHGYYGRWLGGIETLLVEAGIFTQEEITERAVALGADPGDRIAARPSPYPDPMGEAPQDRSSRRALESAPGFAVGDSVITVSQSVPGHTRLPAYARGKRGVITASHDGWVLPDSNAHGRGEQPQPLYTVCFDSETLWGAAGFTVSLDLFESYLQSAEEVS